MLEFFNDIFILLDRHNNHVIILTVYLSVAAALIILRVVSHIHFRGVLMAFQIESSKEVKSRGDVAKLKNGLLRKTAADYIRVAERAVTSVPTDRIVERNISKMSLLGWRYDGLLPFIEGLESGLLWIGLILAMVFSERVHVFGITAVVIFVLLRIIAAFFNVRGARAQLADEMSIYLEREIGRFYASDSGGSILRLKNDLTEATDRQAEAFKSAMAHVSTTMADAMSEVTKNMIAAANSIGPIVASAMDEKLVNMNETLTQTLGDWESALKEATKVQSSMNDASDKMAHASGRLQSSSELLATHMQGHSGALSEQLITLVDAIKGVKAAVETLDERQDVFIKQSAFIEENQRTLETSLASYEESLQNLTSSLGDGIGAYINLHAQASAQTINEALKSNLDKFMHLLKGAKHDDPAD